MLVRLFGSLTAVKQLHNLKALIPIFLVPSEIITSSIKEPLQEPLGMRGMGGNLRVFSASVWEKHEAPKAFNPSGRFIDLNFLAS